MNGDAAHHPALLPAGLRDLLPPEAEIEAAAVETVMAAFAAHGYARVKPPLLEFEDTLLTGSGAAVADQIFRLMDPDTRRMMGLRADMTPQVARIASTRLAGAARPLRLSYAGQGLRVHGNAIAPDRQVAQAGIELIGHDSPEADAEIVLVGAEALRRLGISAISFDLTMPRFISTLLDESGVREAAGGALALALDRKDAAGVAAHGGRLAGVLTDLLQAAGPSAGALAALGLAGLPPMARRLADRLGDVAAAIRGRDPGLLLTVDPVEFRGFKYHTGVAMTVYALDRPEELGRGGRYVVGEDGAGEPATGLTLYPDAMLRAAPTPAVAPRLFVPQGGDGAAWRARGYVTVAGLDRADPAGEAVRLGCSHWLSDSELVPAGSRKGG